MANAETAKGAGRLEELEAEGQAAPTRVEQEVYVWEVPVRTWHWVNAACIVALAVTGFLIGRPPPSVPGEASQHYVVGYIRFVHFAAGYGVGVGFLMRLYWAFAGNKYARQMFTLPVTDRQWWREVIRGFAWYLFLDSHPKRYVGHNPQARLVTVLLYTLGSLFMMCTGFALYGEGAGDGSWASRAFGWVIPLLGGSQLVHTFHRLGMWALVIFVIAHIYAVVRDDIMSRTSQVSSMVSGWRTFKE